MKMKRLTLIFIALSLAGMSFSSLAKRQKLTKYTITEGSRFKYVTTKCSFDKEMDCFRIYLKDAVLENKKNGDIMEKNLIYFPEISQNFSESSSLKECVMEMVDTLNQGDNGPDLGAFKNSRSHNAELANNDSIIALPLNNIHVLEDSNTINRSQGTVNFVSSSTDVSCGSNKKGLDFTTKDAISKLPDMEQTKEKLSELTQAAKHYGQKGLEYGHAYGQQGYGYTAKGTGIGLNALGSVFMWSGERIIRGGEYMKRGSESVQEHGRSQIEKGKERATNI